MLLGLRDPLARIELALARTEPALAGDDEGAGAIRAAVAEADARLEDALRLLRGGADGAADGDCREALRELADRLRAPLAARGVALTLAEAPGPVPGDPVRLRRALLGLLRSAADWAGADGSVRVGVAQEPECTGLHALVRAGRGPARDFSGDALVRFAMGAGGVFSAEPAGEGALALSLWLPEAAA
jgi:signal transduction histidine kinase